MYDFIYATNQDEAVAKANEWALANGISSYEMTKRGECTWKVGQIWENMRIKSFGLRFYGGFHAAFVSFKSINDALQADISQLCTMIADHEKQGYRRNYGYAVIFRVSGETDGYQYGWFLHNESRYYSSYAPDNAKCLYGCDYSEWDTQNGKPVRYERIGNVSAEEKRLLTEAGFAALVGIIQQNEVN